MLIVYTPNKGAFPDLLLPHAAFMHIWLKLQILRSEYTNILFFCCLSCFKIIKNTICAYVWDFSFQLRWDLCISCSTRMLSGVSLCWRAHIVRLTWFRGGSPQNQSDEQKTESAGGDISQNTDESAPPRVHKRSDSPPDKPVYCPPNLETSLHSLSALSFNSSVITTMAQRRKINFSCTAKMEDRAWIVCGNTPAAQLWSTDERMANNHSTEQSKRQGFTQDCARCPPPAFYSSYLMFLPPLWKAILFSVQMKNKYLNGESLSSDSRASEEFLKNIYYFCSG